MSKLRVEYYPGIQHEDAEGIHITGSFGSEENKGKLMIICHHNNSTLDETEKKNSKDITAEPSFTIPAKEFLDMDIETRTGGVYYYRANKKGKSPLFYAGKGANLYTRAGNKVRISDKDYVVLIKRENGTMDENWQTQLEFLMYNDLLERKKRGEVQVQNKASVSESLCSLEEKIKIKEFFDEMITCLENLNAWKR